MFSIRQALTRDRIMAGAPQHFGDADLIGPRGIESEDLSL